MRLSPLAAILLVLLPINSALSERDDYFHENISDLAARFTSLNIPNLEKIQLPQAQEDGSYIFIYIWIPKTHRPTKASFEANIGDYFDIIGAQSKVYDGWCYVRRPEKIEIKTAASDVGVMRIQALGYHGAAPRKRCGGGFPGAAGQLGHTQLIKDPKSGLISMVRSGHPTRFPLAGETR